MMHYRRHLISIVLLVVATCLTTAAAQAEKSTKAERNLIKEGVEAYKQGNFAKAMIDFETALAEAPSSEVTRYNLAAAQLHYGMGQGEQGDSLVSVAVESYKKLGEHASNVQIRESANFNLGNHAFGLGQYKESIDYYKKVLRSNPSNLRARENLRVAQLKLPPEDQKQDQQQDQQDQQQDQQDQQQQQQPQQQQPQPMSENAEQILQIMQNRENQTRENAQQQQAAPAQTDKPW